MFDIPTDTLSKEFKHCWHCAGAHIQNQAQGNLPWLRCHLHPPFSEHLSFRLGNQLFFIRIEVEDEEIGLPGSRELLFTIADVANGIACLMPMKRIGEKWQPVLNGWGLKDADSDKLLNPVDKINDELIEASDWELQDFAIQIVRTDLEKEGYKLMSWQSNPEVFPSIWYVGDSGPEWVAVQAARYPEAEPSPPANISEIAEGCEKLSKKGNIAVITFANADDSFDPDAKNNGNFLPIYRGHGIYPRYNGLQPYQGFESLS